MNRNQSCGYILLLFFLGTLIYFCDGQRLHFGLSSMRDLQRTCPGLCYFFNEAGMISTDKTTPCAKDLSCSAVLSIERFKPQHCGEDVQPELNKIFCCHVNNNRSGELFQITMARRIDSGSCSEFVRNCLPTEFLAVAFSENPFVDNEETPYYTCISRSAYVQSVIQNTSALVNDRCIIDVTANKTCQNFIISNDTHECVNQESQFIMTVSLTDPTNPISHNGLNCTERSCTVATGCTSINAVSCTTSNIQIVRDPNCTISTESPTIQLTFTSPFPRMANSMFWSNVVDGDDQTLICSFLLSSKPFQYVLPSILNEKQFSRQNATTKEFQAVVDPAKFARDCTQLDEPLYSDHTNKIEFNPLYITLGSAPNSSLRTFEFGKFDWTIKLARGRVTRDKDNRVVNVRISNTPTNTKDNSTCSTTTRPVDCDQAKIWVVTNKLTDNMIPTITLINTTKSTSTFDDIKSKEAMEKVHRDCIKKKSLCYILSHQRGCLHKQNCHLLIAITDTDRQKNFEKLHFDMIIQTPESQGEVRLVRPKGWGAFGLSTDNRMGLDFVFTCSTKGTVAKTLSYPTRNIRRANLYCPELNAAALALYPEFENQEYHIWKRDPELEPRFMCSFDIKTVFNMTDQHDCLIPFNHTFVRNYNLKNQVFTVLLAQGSYVGETWKLTYHTSSNREVADRKFSRQIYKEQTSGSPSTHRHRNSTISSSFNFWIAFYFPIITIITLILYDNCIFNTVIIFIPIS